MKKILNIVLNDFKNDSRVLKTSRSLSKKGTIVTVAAMWAHGLKERESFSWGTVNRIKLRSRPLPKWKPLQIIKYIEFSFRVFFNFRKVNIVHCNDLNALPIGILIKLFGDNVKVIYDCHEYETEMYGLAGIQKKLKKFLERNLIKHADKVVCVSESIAKDYERIYNISKPYVVLNCPEFKEQKRSNLFREILGIREDQVIFLYQGALSRGRGIEILLEAFQNLNSGRHVLVCMGYGPLEPLIRSKARISDTIYFSPAVSPDVLLQYTSSADFGVSFIEDSCLSYRFCLPNKVFEYLMAGVPILTSNLYEMKSLVDREKVGIAAESNTIEGFRRAVFYSEELNYAEILQSVFQARKKYCWENQELILDEIYNDFL